MKGCFIDPGQHLSEACVDHNEEAPNTFISHAILSLRAFVFNCRSHEYQRAHAAGYGQLDDEGTLDQHAL